MNMKDLINKVEKLNKLNKELDIKENVYLEVIDERGIKISMSTIKEYKQFLEEHWSLKDIDMLKAYNYNKEIRVVKEDIEKTELKEIGFHKYTINGIINIELIKKLLHS